MNEMLLDLWHKTSRLPFGNKIFSCLLGMKVPYTGSIGATVLMMEPGRVQVALRDRRKVRNHLNSIHAVALMNLGEMTSGLALLSSLNSDTRAIATHLEIDFLKKARGTLRGIADIKPPRLEPNEKREIWVEATILNSEDEIVARVKALWLLERKTK